MIVADTNVLSEPLRPSPDPRVLAWLAAHRHELTTTSITVGELRYGARRLPAGRRRDQYQRGIEQLIISIAQQLLILSYDEAAADHYATVRARRESRGRQIGILDTMIASICLATGAELATRNVRDFADTGLTIHNPWDFTSDHEPN